MLSRKTNPYLELIALLALLIACGMFFSPDDPLLARFSPSPYAVPILLIALRYGNPAGLIAGLFCAALQTAGHVNFSFATLKESIFLTPEDMILPGALVIAGHLIGESIHAARKRQDFVQSELVRTREHVNSLESEKGRIEQAYRQIEGQIAGETNSLYGMLKGVRALDGCDPLDIPKITVSLAGTYLKASHVQLWRNRAGKWEQLAPGQPGAVPPSLLVAALREKGILTARDLPDAAAESGCELACVQSLQGTCDTLGLTVGGIQFSLWHGRIDKLAEAILREAALATQRATLEEHLTERLPFEREFLLAGESFLRQHVQKALLSQERAGGISSLLILRPGRPLQKDKRIFAVIASALRCLLRTSDTRAFLRERGCFAIFMPNTPETGAEMAAEKILSSLRGLELTRAGTGIHFEHRLFPLARRDDLDEILKKLTEESWQ